MTQLMKLLLHTKSRLQSPDVPLLLERLASETRYEATFVPAVTRTYPLDGHMTEKVLIAFLVHTKTWPDSPYVFSLPSPSLRRALSNQYVKNTYGSRDYAAATSRRSCGDMYIAATSRRVRGEVALTLRRRPSDMSECPYGLPYNSYMHT